MDSWGGDYQEATDTLISLFAVSQALPLMCRAFTSERSLSGREAEAEAEVEAEADVCEREATLRNSFCFLCCWLLPTHSILKSLAEQLATVLSGN